VPLPVPATLLRELYVDIGLSIHHIALLIGLGDMATRNPAHPGRRAVQTITRALSMEPPPVSRH
jgi:hypothetical protein